MGAMPYSARQARKAPSKSPDLHNIYIYIYLYLSLSLSLSLSLFLSLSLSIDDCRKYRGVREVLGN